MPKHSEQRILPYAPEQLFDLVAAIERYPEFLPWCLAARITKREGDIIDGDLVIGFKFFRERFSSRVTLDRAQNRIDVRYTQGPLKNLDNRWQFLPHDQGCLVDFYVDFEFRSRLLQKMIELLFNEAVKRMVTAFENRAHHLYRPQLATAGAPPQRKKI